MGAGPSGTSWGPGLCGTSQRSRLLSCSAFFVPFFIFCSHTNKTLCRDPFQKLRRLLQAVGHGVKGDLEQGHLCQPFPLLSLLRPGFCLLLLLAGPCETPSPQPCLPPHLASPSPV